MKGGIASYLIQIYFKYFRNTDFLVVLPKWLSKETGYSNMPFKVIFTDFASFNFADKKRDDCNKKILKILSSFKPDIILFGYIRSHPEVSLMYKKINPSSKLGIFMYGKEAFIDSAVVSQNHKGKSHKGYLKKEVNFYKSVLNKFDYIFSVSKFTKNILINQGIKKKIIVLHPSVSKVKRISSATARKKLGFKKEWLMLLSVGRLIKRKGQDKVIQVLPKLLKKHPNLKYVIVGSGPEKKSLTTLVNKSNLSENVLFVDDVPDDELPFYYSASDIFVLPCDFIKPNDIEGFGIVFLEANSYGLPSIGGNSGGVPETIIEGKTGLLVNPKSKTDLIKKINYLVEHPEFRKKIYLFNKKIKVPSRIKIFSFIKN